MTMFEMIDALEPIIPQREMNAMHALTHRIWTKNNPEAHKAIYDRQNAKRAAERKEGKDYRGT